MLMESKYMLDAREVANLLGIKTGKAYKLIRLWNSELDRQGKFTLRGKINRKYFEKKLEV